MYRYMMVLVLLLCGFVTQASAAVLRGEIRGLARVQDAKTNQYSGWGSLEIGEFIQLTGDTRYEGAASADEVSGKRVRVLYTKGQGKQRAMSVVVLGSDKTVGSATCSAAVLKPGEACREGIVFSAAGFQGTGVRDMSIGWPIGINPETVFVGISVAGLQTGQKVNVEFESVNGRNVAKRVTLEGD